MDNIEEAAKKLSKEKDINVVIVTTRDKGSKYSDSDEDEKRFAEDYYMKSVKTVPLQNNSGVCILIDVTLDYQGGRFFWLYTYGTAHFAVSDDECMSLFRRYLSLLGDARYGEAVENITNDLNEYSYQSYAAIVFFTIIIPIGMSFLSLGIATPKRRLDKLPAIGTYSMPESLPFMYGVEAALGSVIPNGIQASAAIVGAVPLMYVKLFDKYQLSQQRKEVHDII